MLGYVVYVHLSQHTKHKLEPRAVKCLFIGYGVNQKGYHCFDPFQNKIYTTIDCEFFEDTYYYTMHSPNREMVSNDLSWLTHPIVIDFDLKEQVDTPIVVATEEMVLFSPQTTPILSDPSKESPGIEEHLEVHSELDLEITNDILVVYEACRYELPRRSTRRVPSKRYDPEYEAQRS